MSQSAKEKFARVRELRDKELAERPVARSLDFVPVAYDLIGNEWLSAILCKDTPGAQVVDHSLDAPSEGTSNRRRIFVKYNDAGNQAGLPPSVFCKATQAIESRFILGMCGCSDAEPNFYKRIRPTLDIEAPEALFANSNPESLNSIIVMKDLQGKVDFCDQNTEISLERAKSQMRVLARYHGVHYQDKPRHKLLDVFFTYENFCEALEDATGWSDACRRGFIAGEEFIPPRLFKRAAEIWPATEKAWNLHARLPRTLVHGDVHLKNWYVRPDNQMGLIDWQCCVRGHWSRDLVYVITTSLTVENRRAWEKTLVEYYLEQLAANGVPAISLDRAMQLYRTQLFPTLAFWTGTLTPSPGAPAMQPPETSIKFIDRITHAMDDLDALGVAFE